MSTLHILKNTSMTAKILYIIFSSLKCERFFTVFFFWKLVLIESICVLTFLKIKIFIIYGIQYILIFNFILFYIFKLIVNNSYLIALCKNEWKKVSLFLTANSPLGQNTLYTDKLQLFINN